MWYKFIKQYMYVTPTRQASLFDELNSTPLMWKGNIKDTFKGVSNYSSNSVSSLIQILKNKDFLNTIRDMNTTVQSLPPNYDGEIKCPIDVDELNALNRITSVLFTKCINNNQYDEIMNDVLSLFQITTQINQKLLSYNITNNPATLPMIGGDTYFDNSNDVYIPVIQKLGYEKMSELLDLGLIISPAIAFGIINNLEHSVINITNDTNKQKLIDKFYEKMPYTKLYSNDKDGKNQLIKYIDSEDYTDMSSTFPILAQTLGIDNINNEAISQYLAKFTTGAIINTIGDEATTNLLQSQALKAWVHRGYWINSIDASYEKIQHNILTDIILENAGSEENGIFLSPYYKKNAPLNIDNANAYMQSQLEKIYNINKKGLYNTNNFDNVVTGYIETFPEDKDQQPPKDVLEKLRNAPNIQKVVKNEMRFSFDDVFSCGILPVPEIEKILLDNPILIEKIKTTEGIPYEFLNRINTIATQENDTIQNKIKQEFDNLIAQGKVKIQKLSDNPGIIKYLEEEGTLLDISDNDLKNINNIDVFYFNVSDIKKIIKKYNTDNLGNITINNFQGKYSPAWTFNDNKPTIIINTFYEDTNTKAFQNNLNISNEEIQNNTLMHETAHGIQLNNTPLDEFDILNDPIYKHDDKQSHIRNYITSPLEIFARSHGDIPYLRKMFGEKLLPLLSSSIVQNAIKQAIYEMMQNGSYLLNRQEIERGYVPNRYHNVGFDENNLPIYDGSVNENTVHYSYDDKIEAVQQFLYQQREKVFNKILPALNETGAYLKKHYNTQLSKHESNIIHNNDTSKQLINNCKNIKTTIEGLKSSVDTKLFQKREGLQRIRFDIINLKYEIEQTDDEIKKSQLMNTLKHLSNQFQKYQNMNINVDTETNKINKLTSEYEQSKVQLQPYLSSDINIDNFIDEDIHLDNVKNSVNFYDAQNDTKNMANTLAEMLVHDYYVQYFSNITNTNIETPLSRNTSTGVGDFDVDEKRIPEIENARPNPLKSHDIHQYVDTLQGFSKVSPTGKGRGLEHLLPKSIIPKKSPEEEKAWMDALRKRTNPEYH